MTKVFISYSRKDKVFAAKLKAALDAMGLEAWIDWIDIPPTADWWEQIQKGIETSDAFLFLCSPASVISKVCIQEVDHAIQNGKRLIPLVIQDINAKDAHPALTRLNWIFFRDQDDFDISLRTLETAIKTDLAWLEFHRRLQVRGVEWEKRRDRSLLLRGKDLREAEEQLTVAGQKDPQPTDLQRQYVLESRKAESRIRNVVLAVGAIVMATLAFLSVFAFNQSRLAENNAQTAVSNLNLARTSEANAINETNARATAQANAEEQARISRAGELSAQAVSIRDTQFDLSLLLSIEAFREDDTLQSRSALLDNSQANPNLLQYMYGHNGWVDHISFSPDGKTLLSGSEDGTILIWDISTRQQIGQLLTENAAQISNMILSPDGKTLVSTYSDGRVVFWDLRTQQAIGQQLLTAEASYTVSSMDFSPDGKNLALGTREGPILFWDVATRQAVGTPFEGYIDSVTSIDFSPDGETLVSGSQDGTIVVWDVKTRQPSEPPRKDYSDFIIDIAFSPNEKFFLSSSESGHAILWDSTTGLPIEIPFSEPTGQSGYRKFDFSPDGKYVAFLQCQTVDREGSCIQSEVILWDSESRHFIDHPLRGITYNSYSLTFSPDGRKIAAGSCQILDTQGICSKGKIILWDIEILHPIGQLFQQKSNLSSTSVALSPDGRILAAGHRDGRISLWDAKTRQQIDELMSRANHPVQSLAFSPDGKKIAAAYYDHSVLLWDLATYQSIALPLTGISDRINSVSFNPDGDVLVAANSEGNIIFWDLVTDKLRDQLAFAAIGQVNNVEFSPDGEMLAWGSDDGSILLWALNTRQVISRMLPQSRFLFTVVTFSSVEKILAAGYSSGSAHGAIILWDLVTKQSIGQPITGDTGWYRIGQIADLDFSSDGKSLVSASRTDGAVIVWNLDPQSWIEKACFRSGRNLSRAEWTQYFPNKEYRATCEQWPLEPESP